MDVIVEVDIYGKCRSCGTSLAIYCVWSCLDILMGVMDHEIIGSWTGFLAWIELAFGLWSLLQMALDQCNGSVTTMETIWSFATK